MVLCLRDHSVETVFMKNDEITKQEEDETALAQINGPLLDLNHPETWTKQHATVLQFGL